MAWTDYAEQRMVDIAIGGGPVPTLYLALFAGTANPASRSPELTLAGYGRQQIGFQQSTGTSWPSAFDVSFGAMAAGSYQGLSIFEDPLTGNAWFWDDLSAVQTIVAGSAVTFLAGQLVVSRNVGP